MSNDNPLQPVLVTLERISHCVRIQLSRLFDGAIHPSPTSENLLALSREPSTGGDSGSVVVGQPRQVINKTNFAEPASKEDLGRATWTFLHTLGAQYPEHPTRQQKKDVKELMAILSRMYPCKECADHFKEVLSDQRHVFRANPVEAGSQAEFSQWLCHVHNVVNRSLGKAIFPCERVDARWGKLDCEKRLCDLQGSDDFQDKFL
ncbi:FAD-linked sulfhydryl oxidase ERV1-like protein [Drosera capensis]